MAIRNLPAELPVQHYSRDASQIRTRIHDDAIDREARTVNVTFTTGAAVRRHRWAGWDSVVPFDEILEVSRSAINMDRLDRGAPALDSHSSYSLSMQIGVIERAWIEGNEGRATIRFPKAGIDVRADVIFEKVADKIIRNVSVGYSIDKARVVESEKKGEVEKRIVERWTPMEISFVPIGADAGAQVRSHDAGTFPLAISFFGSTQAAMARMRMRALHLTA